MVDSVLPTHVHDHLWIHWIHGEMDFQKAFDWHHSYVCEHFSSIGEMANISKNDFERRNSSATILQCLVSGSNIGCLL